MKQLRGRYVMVKCGTFNFDIKFVWNILTRCKLVSTQGFGYFYRSTPNIYISHVMVKVNWGLEVPGLSYLL